MSSSSPNSNDNNSSSSSSPPRRGTLTELFAKGNGPPSSFPLATTAAAQSSRRRSSIAASLGLNTAATNWNGGAMNSMRNRRGSSSANGDSPNGSSPSFPGSLEDNAIEEEGSSSAGPTSAGRSRSSTTTASGNEPSTPVSPFLRRMSFGARAHESLRRDGGENGGSGEKFNWHDHTRQRAESTVERCVGGTLKLGNAGLRSASGNAGGPAGAPATETKSAPTPTAIPPQPKSPPRKFDHHEEKIMRGGYMMD